MGPTNLPPWITSVILKVGLGVQTAVSSKVTVESPRLIMPGVARLQDCGDIYTGVEQRLGTFLQGCAESGGSSSGGAALIAMPDGIDKRGQLQLFGQVDPPKSDRAPPFFGGPSGRSLVPNPFKAAWGDVSHLSGWNIFSNRSGLQGQQI